MKRIDKIFLVSVSILFSAFSFLILSPGSFGETLTSDFLPPQGSVEGPGKFGPWTNRLMIAVSDDGLNFTRTNRVITDQGDVPDLVQDSFPNIEG